MMALHSLCDERAEGDRQALPAANDLRRHLEDVLRGDCRRQILHRTNSGEVRHDALDVLQASAGTAVVFIALLYDVSSYGFLIPLEGAGLCFSVGEDRLNILA